MCKKCHGSGIEGWRVHVSETEMQQEPLKCDDCDGFGWVDPDAAYYSEEAADIAESKARAAGVQGMDGGQSK